MYSPNRSQQIRDEIIASLKALHRLCAGFRRIILKTKHTLTSMDLGYGLEFLISVMKQKSILVWR